MTPQPLKNITQKPPLPNRALIYRIASRGVTLMRLARQLAALGFVIGFGAPMMFFFTTPPFFPYHSDLVCAWCAHAAITLADRFPATPLGLRVGFLSGLTFALAGFLIGYLAALARRKR